MSDKVRFTLWGREFELHYIFQNYRGEKTLQNQEETVARIAWVDFQEAQEEVKRFINKHDKEKLGGDTITNLFRYVMPKSVLIPREEEKRVFALMCDYKFDMEHGLAIVFENEKLSEVGPQDIIL